MREMKEKRHEGKPGPYCGRCPYKDEPLVPATENRANGVMVVGQGPGAADVKAGHRYSGTTGKRLQKQLSFAGIFLDSCWVDDVVQCKVPATRKPTKTAMKCCRPQLEKAMAECRPHTIITLGVSALEGFYPGATITAYHGSKIQGEDYTLVPMYQPNAFDDNPNLLRTIISDYRGMRDRPMLEQVDGDYSMSKLRPIGNDRCAIDTETTGLDLRSKLLGMSISEDTGMGICVLDHQVPRGISFPGHVVMHNAKYDLGILDSNGVASLDSWEDVDDTLLLAYCMNRSPLGLKPLAIQELHLEQPKFSDVAENKTLVGVDPELWYRYACGDSDLTLRLWYHLWERASARERQLYEQIEKPLPRLFADMQLRGVRVDVAYFEGLSSELGFKLGRMSKVIRRMDGCGALWDEVLTSPTQLAKFLSVLLKRQVKSTEKYALEKLEDRHPVVKAILEWRSLYKLKTAFVDSILNLQRGGFVHPNFNQAGTGTGRVSCSWPNLQQLPKRTDTTVREGFTALDGFVVVSIDNSQIDLRSLAYLSQDTEMLRIFRENLDMHDETATDIKGSLTDAHRRLAKTANFLVVFGGGAAALAAKTGVEEDVAYDFMDRYWERHPGVELWVHNTHDFLIEHGYVETAYGRRRFIPKVSFFRERGKALREGQNMPVQGTSADVLKLQTKAVSEAGTGALMFGQIHDEINFYVPEDNWKERTRELVRAMEGVDCPFDLKVAATAGPNLGKQEKVAF